jgi:hypothetical protein
MLVEELEVRIHIILKHFRLKEIVSLFWNTSCSRGLQPVIDNGSKTTIEPA